MFPKKNLNSSEPGIAEYALIVGLAVLVIIGALWLLGSQTGVRWELAALSERS